MMKNLNLNQNILLCSILTLFLTVGCASNIKEMSHTSAEPSEVDVGNKVYFEITTAGDFRSSKNYQSTVDKLKLHIIENLKEQNPSYIFPNSERGDNGLLVHIDIKDFRYVSGGARFWGGIIAGKARLSLLVKLSGLETNEVLNETSLGTASELKQGIFGGTTSRQVEAMSVKIVEMITSL